MNTSVLEQHGTKLPFHEQRSEQRLPYRVCQRVAFCTGFDGKPGEFSYFLFHDLADRGCSFFAPAPPPTNKLIIELGEQGKSIRFKALVVHITPMDIAEQTMFVIGCRFTARMA